MIITRQNFLQNNRPDDLLTKVQSIFGDQGSIIRHEYWGLRNFTYIIRRKRRGHYVLIYADAKVAAIEELQRKMFLDDNILRYNVMRVDSIPTKTSPLMQDPEMLEETDVQGDENAVKLSVSDSDKKEDDSDKIGKSAEQA